MSELVGRAVEAAARELSNRRTMTPWDEASERWREKTRSEVRRHVEVGLGVVADHCTTEAERVEAAANGVPGAFSVAGIAARAFREVAAECRGETPDGLG